MCSCRSFHSLQATWHALQPMHFDTSISFATGVSCRAGGGTDEAERRIRSASPRSTLMFSVGAGGRTNSKVIVCSCRSEIGARIVAEGIGEQRGEIALIGVGTFTQRNDVRP